MYPALRFGFAALLYCAASVAVSAQQEQSHAEFIRSWNEETFARGQALYGSICITCHGTPEKEGTLPTSRAFWKEPFKNGHDPLRIFKTLTDGLGQMPAWPTLTPQDRYDVIHFVREAFLKSQNPSAYFPISETYLKSLPQEPLRVASDAGANQIPPYLKMNFGPALNWTYEIEPGNISYKGIAIRLDPGPGGVSKGRAWMIYDHDTMRVAAAWTGTNFIDWKGIAFDGSHGTHASIVGQKAFVLPFGPGWANPKDGSFTDDRLRGLDGKMYGPLSRDWAHLKGIYHNGNTVALRYTVGNTEITEVPGLMTNETTIAFTRALNIAASTNDLSVRLAPMSTAVQWKSDKGLRVVQRDGLSVLEIPADQTPVKIVVALATPETSTKELEVLAQSMEVTDLAPLLRGGHAKWNFEMQTEVETSNADGPFANDVLTLPSDKLNPWNSWMRLGGFDFFADGDTAAICTWLGEVWLVRGVAEGTHLRWKRIAAGLFQPLGLKIIDGTIFVACRDQIVRLVDLNGDEEIDLYENFNSDHQVTEHFHEFAMGLQTDRAGNFYYAKSARHALPPLVPHHGTLLRVSKDGSRTDIVASGFRAANGVCVNDDGTFFVTDQEGHWTPKNRINHIFPGRFYGNMWSYHHPENSADSAMEQPLVWITNEMDRSPGELVRIASERWGALNGALLNLSYGTGRIFLVPHEFIGGQAQGGMVQLPMPELPTGVMRGRVHPKNGALYASGLVAWASNKAQDGGFYRIYPTGKALHLPTHIKSVARGMEITFTEPLDKSASGNARNYSVKSWSLKRSANYGSKHINEQRLEITRATLLSDKKTVRLEIAGFQPTWGMEIRCKLQSETGEHFERIIHNTVHKIPSPEN